MAQGVIKSKIYIPLEDVKDFEALKRAYTVDGKDEVICNRCQYKHDELMCSVCPANNAIINLWGMKTINGFDYVTLPAGNLKRVTKYTGIDFSSYKDLRCEAKFDYPIKWTGKLRAGEEIDGIPTANQQEIVDTWLREDKKYGFICAPPRTGKCLCGNTLVNTQDGFLYLNEFIKEDGVSPLVKKISSLDGEELTEFAYKSKAKTIKIKTNRGYELQGTYEHPVLTLQRDLTFAWKCLQDIQIGDCIVGKPKNQKPIFGTDNSVKLDEAILLGYFLANGRCNIIHSKDLDVIKQVRLSCKNLNLEFWEGFKASEPSQKEIHILGFSERLKQLGYKTGALNKNLGKLIRSSSREIIKATLESYFECDSSSNGSFIQLISASETFVNQLQVILNLGFGISGEKFSVKRKLRNKDREYFGVTITGVDAHKFCLEFPKAKVVRKYKDRFRRDYYNYQECKGKKFIPFVYAYFEKLASETKINFGKHYFPKSGYKGYLSLSFDLYRKNIDMLLCHIDKWIKWNEKKLKDIDFSSYEKLKRVLELSNDYQIITDKNFIDSESDVYDLQVPNSHSFIANGLISHNSVLAVNLCCQMGLKTLFVVHQSELLDNFMKSFLRDTNLKELQFDTGKELVKIIESKKDLEDPSIQVAMITYQKFIREGASQDITKFLKGKFGFVIIDEAHQAGAIAYAKFLSQLDCKYRLGISATPMRKDSLNYVLLNLIGPVTVKSNAVGMIPKVEIVETAISYDNSNVFAHFVKNMTECKERNELLVNEVFEDLKEHKCILIPVDTVKHMNCLVNMINKRAGDDIALAFYSRTMNRANIIKDIDAGKYRVVVAIKSMIKQGIDLKLPTMIYIQILMSAKDNKVGAPMFYQMGNRVCTPYTGKRQPIIKIFFDPMPISYLCFRSIYSKEILPHTKPKDGEDRPRYLISDKARKYARNVLNRIASKQYTQEKFFNPDKESENSS